MPAVVAKMSDVASVGKSTDSMVELSAFLSCIVKFCPGISFSVARNLAVKI